MAQPPIYLDYNATTPLDDAVSASMLPYLQGRFGNPSSGHWYGIKEKQAVNTARENVAALIGCEPAELIFTSGGTESVNWALKGVADTHANRGKHIITSKVEHVVVLECCKYLQATQGFEITYLDVDEYGRVSADDVKLALRADTILCSIMHANNETGSINPIAEISQIVRNHGALMHTDASQSVGKIPVDVKELGVDMLTIAGHKLYAPAGIGALYVRTGTVLGKFMHGAGHEDGRRAGTENTMHMVALGTACARCRELLAEEGGGPLKSLRETRDALHALLLEAFPDLTLNGHPEERLPNTLNVSFPPSAPSSYHIILASSASVAFSAGSACHAGDECHISHVLAAMGADKLRAARACRFSTGRYTTLEQVRAAAAAIIAAARTVPDASSARPAVPSCSLPACAAPLHPAVPRGPACALPSRGGGGGDGEIRLTTLTAGGGCGCKIAPAVLTEILRRTIAAGGPAPAELLVGTETADDAAVYQVLQGVMRGGYWADVEDMRAEIEDVRAEIEEM
jgi:cysteine desulfurase